MRQYTTPTQTVKLIELGFEIPFPKWVKMEDGNCRSIEVFSIGELIEMLPSHITHGDRGFVSNLSIVPYVQGWKAAYTHIYIMLDSELIDALYYMIIKLKEEGVI